MTHYRSNVRDMLFDLFELLDRQSAYGNQPFTEIDQDAATAVLEEAERYARTKLAETFGDGGRNQLSFDPDTHTVALPKEYREAVVDYLRSGWLELEFPPANLNELVPPSLCWCVNELMLGANPAIPQGVNVVPQVVRLLLSAGTPEQRRLAELIREKHWMVTMMLTEPDAGSDVGSARTRALPQPDGSWHLDGVKRFITYGDHDLSDNIVHAVLARPVGVEGVGGPGTKGLSLFVVPKYHVDLETGELGARNGVHVTGVEHKMGLHGSPTCEVTFGQHEPAIGWLLGERHAGIAQMFEIIKHIRMLVGVKSLAALSTGYLNARDFAQTRVQGPPLVRRDAGSGSVPIIEHPDLRRSLLTQKAYVEGMRALVLYAGAQQDRIVAAGGDEDVADRRHQLLLPVIKGFCSEMACQLLGQEAMQTFGGSGFLKDYPVEQYLRDTKVDTLYEGTTAIQGLDLLSRKIVRDRGETLDALLNEIRETATTPGPGYEIESRLLLEATDAFAQFARLLVDRWSAGGQEKETAAQDSTRLLLRLGDLLCGWLLLRSGHIADAALAGPAPLTETERDFYTGKAATGRWFARRVLPGLTSDLASARLAWTGLGSVPPTAF